MCWYHLSKSTCVAVTIFLAFLAHSVTACADGALAIGLSDSARKGWSVGYEVNDSDGDSAQHIALSGCQQSAKSPQVRQLCRVIDTFRDQCVAEATDHDLGFGWAIAEQMQLAQEQALSRCRATAGPSKGAACKIGIADCDGKANTVESLSDMIARSPKFAAAYIRRSIAYIEKADFDRALADCDQAIRLDANNAEAYKERSIVWDKKGNLDRAIDDSEQVIRLNLIDAAGYNNRGYFRYKKGDLDGAMADYDSAIRLDPKLIKPHIFRGGYLGKQGRL
jgi:tetratricopeptide (TPR) repeat protein